MKHGHAPAGNYSPTYISWKGMIQRCTNPKNPRYKDYGGRGITVCPTWRNFVTFLTDMGERPPGLSLERVNNDKSYSKKNCVWATQITQNNNQRLRKDSPLGIKGIVFQQNRFYATVRVEKKLRYLYSGVDFFEACCARKRWDAHTNATHL